MSQVSLSTFLETNSGMFGEATSSSPSKMNLMLKGKVSDVLNIDSNTTIGMNMEPLSSEAPLPKILLSLIIGLKGSISHNSSGSTG